MTKYKNFPQEFWIKIEKALEQDLKKNSRPVAAFDADGTLWAYDMGENFFQWQIAHSGLVLPEDPWHYYRRWKESGDPRPAYLWLAQINEGHSLAEVRSWAESALKSHGELPYFPDQKQLIERLQSWGVAVFVVTASVKWSVEPGATFYGIPPEQVLGVQTEIDSQNQVTKHQKGPITWREGKMEALLQATGGQRPFLCSGNTFGDISLLEGATELQLAVASAPKDHELYEAENKLQEEATRRGWLRHKF